MNELITAFLNAVASVDASTRTLLASLGIMLETSFLVGLIVPGDTIVLIASSGISTLTEYFAMIVMVILGSLVGETIGFFLGRRFGPAIRSSWVGRKLGEQRWEAADNYLDRRGGIAVFLSRFLPVLHSLVPLTAGMTRMRFGVFIRWTIAACVLWTFTYVSLATVLKTQFVAFASESDWAGWALLGVIVLIVVISRVIKTRLGSREQRFMDAPGDGNPNTIDDPLDS
jgi:membrane-associated protein